MSAHRLRFLVLVTGLMLVSAFSVSAQGALPGSSRGVASGEGNNMIQGRIHFPAGQSVSGRGIKVSLESVSNFGNNTTVADQDGVFRFTSLPAGAYTIVVDAGPEFEKAREAVNIDREASRGGRSVQVAIHLRPKIDASNPAFAGVPEKALKLYEKASAAVKKGDSKDAVQFLNEAIAAHPNFPIALSELGSQYIILKQWEKAGETFDALLKLKPTDPAAHLNLGIALYNQKKAEEAESHLSKALELKSSGPTAHYYRGLTLITLKRLAEAEKEFEAAIANGGENLALAHRYLGGLYMMNADKKQQAVDELEKYLKLDPKAPDADRIKGTIKELKGKQ
jgi:predicted Zn-dependent protease